MEKIFKPTKINRKNFNPYGDLISSDDIDYIDINAGYAKRFDNLANIDTLNGGGTVSYTHLTLPTKRIV